MDVTDVVRLVETLWKTTEPAKRREAFAAIRITIPSENLTLFDCLVDNKREGIKDSSESKVLVLIHGIQTDGSWQRHVQEKMAGVASLQVHDLGYDVFTALQLFGPFRSAPVNKIVREIRRIKTEEPLASICVIAHSYGSYIVSRILDENPDIRFSKIIMCGAIVPRNYPWDRNAKELSKSSIINDVGTRDVWPLFATCTTLGYGSSGRRGFQNASVTDRYFDYSHSEFFEEKHQHVEKFWRPIIENDNVPSSEWDTKKGKTNFLVLLLSHPVYGRFLVAIAISILTALCLQYI